MIYMKYDFSMFEGRIVEVIEWLSNEFIQIQTGRISPAVLDLVKVTVYGTASQIAHIASVSVEGPKTLAINAFDESNIPLIEAALREQLNSFSIAVSQSSIRVIAPDLTQERRELLVKVIKDKKEEAKKSLRGDREKTLDKIKKDAANNVLSEDEERATKEDLQKIVDDINKKIDDMTDNKEKQLQI